MRRICDLPSSKIRSIINDVIAREDNFVNAPPAMKAFTKASGSEDGIQRAIKVLSILREQRTSFFAAMPYEWASDESVYRRSNDATLQVQALQQLAAFSEHSGDYPIDQSGLGQVVCMMAIAPSTFGPGPRVLPALGETNGGIIVFPSGWFAALATFLELARSWISNDKPKLEALIKGIYVRAFVEDCFLKEQMKLDHLDIPIHLQDLIRFEMVKHLESKNPRMHGAITDLRMFRNTPEQWLALDRATVNFAIAHETSHILRGDHNRSASEADESLADNIAFDILAYTPEWKRMTANLPVQDGLACSALACSAFIFVGLLHLRIRRIIEQNDGAQEAAFLDRAEKLQLAAQVQPIPDDQRRACTQQAMQFTEARQRVEQRLLELHSDDLELQNTLCLESFEQGIKRFVG